MTDWPSLGSALLDVANGLRRVVEGLLRAPTPEEASRAIAVGEVVTPAPGPSLRIAIWHYPPTGNDKTYADAFVDRLRGANVTLCLHGHVHEARADCVRHIDPRKPYLVGAGSFGAVAADRPESTPRLYNLLEVPPDRSLIRVHTRCMRKDGGAWEGWAVWSGRHKRERRTFYEIPFSRG